MPSLRSRIAAFRARSRFTGKTLVAKARRMRSSRRKGMRSYALTTSKMYNVHHYRRFATQQTFDTSSGTGYNNVLTFKLADVRSNGELTALYDQYMITGVKVMFKLTTNPDAASRPNIVSTLTSNWYPKMFYSRDYDNDGLETSNDLRERNTTKCVIMRPNKYINVFIKPAIRNQVYLDGVTAATSPIWNQWLDCSSSQVPHYGLKFALDYEGINMAQNYLFSVETVYYMKFKNAR